MKSIDVNDTKRFFKHIFCNDEITDLSKTPKTLLSVIKVGYGFECDGDTDSLSWSEVFADDGRLCFDQIFPLLFHSSELTRREESLYEQTLWCANWALSSYNQNNEGDEYELIAPMLSNIVLLPHSGNSYVLHANFFAKSKDADSLVELFYAEVVALNPGQGNILNCCILPPRFSASPSVVTPVHLFQRILHPRDVDCTHCMYGPGTDSDSD